MRKIYTLMFCAIFVGIVINLLLPVIVTPFATKQEINPPNGAHHLNFKQQIMHMLVHHGQVPVSSSVIIAIIIGLSVCIANSCARV